MEFNVEKPVDTSLPLSVYLKKALPICSGALSKRDSGMELWRALQEAVKDSERHERAQSNVRLAVQWLRAQIPFVLKVEEVTKLLRVLQGLREVDREMNQLRISCRKWDSIMGQSTPGAAGQVMRAVTALASRVKMGMKVCSEGEGEFFCSVGREVLRLKCTDGAILVDQPPSESLGLGDHIAAMNELDRQVLKDMKPPDLGSTEVGGSAEVGGSFSLLTTPIGRTLVMEGDRPVVATVLRSVLSSVGTGAGTGAAP